MGSYKIQVKNSAEQDLSRIDQMQVPRIIKSIESLSDDPFPAQHRKLHGSEQGYRLRIGDYRVIYQVDTQAKMITVYHIRHRKEAYR